MSTDEGSKQTRGAGGAARGRDGGSFLLSTVQFMANWCRKNSVWPLPLGLSCCGIEFMATAASRYDMARFGMEVNRFSPRQADLMLVAGTLTYKMAHVMTRLYDQMAEPKWVIAMGACASSGGMFRSYPVVQGIDEFIPVDFYIPGCPPRPDAVLECLMQLQQKIVADRSYHLALRAPEAPPPTPLVERPGSGRCAGEPAAVALATSGGRFGEEGHHSHVRRAHSSEETRRGPISTVAPLRTTKPVRTSSILYRDAPPEALLVAARDALAPFGPLGWSEHHGDLGVLLEKNVWLDALGALREAGYGWLVDHTAVDYPERRPRFTVVAIVQNMDTQDRLIVKTRVGDGESVASLTPLWAAANGAERETYDMFGITFDDHPDLTRIYLPRDFEGWPLRRDFPLQGHLRFRD